MGLFCVPSKSKVEMTAEDYVECAEANIRLWRENPDCAYLLRDFAASMLKMAAEVVDGKPSN